MAHKYLNKLGVSSKDSCIFNSEDTSDKRYKLFKKQRKKYGFDERETWSLDYTLATWLYEHLCVYEKVTIVRLDYHEFDIPVLYIETDSENENKKKTYTKLEHKNQKEAMDLCIEYLGKYIFSKCNDKFVPFEEEEIICVYYKTALEIISIIFPALWW